jgi:Fe-S oxidoreductase
LGARAANFVARAPLLGQLFKAIVGIAPQRRVPTFAEQTFKQWFQARPRHVQPSERTVVLWADTFNDYFHPKTAIAAVEVLEAAGFNVVVPEADLCCGRPLYDYGMLETAERWLKKMLNGLQPYIRAGTPVIVLEPSCYAVFKDELVNLLPNNQDAQRLKAQTYVLAEFLKKYAPDQELPKLHRRAIVHGHCHQKALIKMEAEEDVLRRMGLDFKVLDSGCCGMAGAFGFELDHYDTSIKVGEHELLPHVRNAGKETLLIADGFSCREQISQTTDRHALHLAQVMQMAIQEGAKSSSREYPERNYVMPEPTRPSLVAAAVAVGAILFAGAALFQSIRRSDR